MSCRDNLHHKLNGSLLLLLGKNQSIESISRINQLIDQSKTHTHTHAVEWLQSALSILAFVLYIVSVYDMLILNVYNYVNVYKAQQHKRMNGLWKIWHLTIFRDKRVKKNKTLLETVLKKLYKEILEKKKRGWSSSNTWMQN